MDTHMETNRIHTTLKNTFRGEITCSTTLYEINQHPDLAAAKDILIGGGKGLFYGDYGKMTLAQLEERQPTWYAEDMVYGLNRLLEVARTNDEYIFYPVEEDKEHVQLFYLPAKEKKTKAFVLLCAGGGYGAVCTFVEALPVAARLNALGIDCFCLNYTTFRPEHMETGYMPAPLSDLAAAWKFVEKEQKRFEIDLNQYYVGGFSAGGHLAALWGTEIGAVHYGIPEPQGLLLAYPLIAPRTIEGELGSLLHDGLAGKSKTDLVETLYSAENQITENYPRTYLVQAVDDDTVPISNSELIEQALLEKKVDHLIERYPAGGHGFGLGSRLASVPWIDTAVNYLGIGA
ncbi:MAG: alpha/beta hydrolase [Blautia sp.]|nr:alpha/beta hydrolase [Blautia sp.]